MPAVLTAARGAGQKPWAGRGTIARSGDSPATSRWIGPVLEPPLFAVFQRFCNQKIELAATGVPIQLRVPEFLLQRVNMLGDLHKLVEAQILNGALDFFDTATAHCIGSSGFRPAGCRPAERRPSRSG